MAVGVGGPNDPAKPQMATNIPSEMSTPYQGPYPNESHYKVLLSAKSRSKTHI